MESLYACMRTGKMKQALAEYLQPLVAPLMLVLQAKCRMQHVLYKMHRNKGTNERGWGCSPGGGGKGGTVTDVPYGSPA